MSRPAEVGWTGPQVIPLENNMAVLGPIQGTVPTLHIGTTQYKVINANQRIKQEFCGDIGWAHMENLFLLFVIDPNSQTAQIVGFLSVETPQIVGNIASIKIHLLCITPQYRRANFGCTLL